MRHFLGIFKLCFLLELKYVFSYRWIQLLESSIGVQEGILLLSDYNLRTILYVSHCLLGLILAGFQVCTSKSIFRCHNFVNHVNSNGWSQQIFTTCSLHQSHRCMVRNVCTMCILSSTRICFRQLCFKVSLTMFENHLKCLIM